MTAGPQPVAELRQVWKSFRDRPALAGVDFAVAPGSVTALLGPNGAGKTTAIRLLLGLRRPDSGRALLFGRDPRSEESRRRCGSTPQETDLPETLRVGEIVDFVRAHFPRPLPREEALRRFGLLELVRRQSGGLSGGQRRRLAVALAFAGDPELVFLDEPSISLDAESRRGLWDSIRAFAARGRTILLTTHDLVEAEALADRVAVVNSGRIVLEGAVDEIRALGGHTRVRVRRQRLPELYNADRAIRNETTITFFTAQPGELVRELVALQADLDELEVTPVGLEEALAEDPR